MIKNQSHLEIIFWTMQKRKVRNIHMSKEFVCTLDNTIDENNMWLTLISHEPYIEICFDDYINLSNCKDNSPYLKLISGSMIKLNV